MTTMMVMAVASIALVNQVMLACFSAAVARQSRFAFACRQAATDRLSRSAPDSDGGNLAPEAPIAEWSDVVYIDPTTGAIRAVDNAGQPTGVLLVERQWRVATDGGGRRVFEVSAVALSEVRVPHTGLHAARVVLSKRVE